MNFEHIVSTMNKEEFSFIEKLNIEWPCLVVNQNVCEGRTTYPLKYGDARIISTPETGLSRSRNMLLKNAIGDICIIGDDDVVYLPNYNTINFG